MLSLGFLVFVIITFVITGITLAVFFFYKGIYDRHTTKVLESGVAAKRKWIAPWGLALIVFLAQLMIVLSVFIPASMFMANTQSKVVEVDVSDHPYLDYSWEPYTVDNSYIEVGTQKTGTASGKLYKKESSDSIVHYYFVGEADISKMDNFNMSIVYSYNKTLGYSESLVAINPEKKPVVYFKFELDMAKDQSGQLVFGFGEGNVVDAPENTKNKIVFDL